MIDFTAKRSTVAKGLREYLKTPVISSNQNKKPPAYPYLSYTITTLAGANNGTWGEYSDGTDRKPFTQTWSITAQSNDIEEAMKYAVMAREWLDHIGTVYLQDNGVIVQSVGGITNRDNILSVEYEYKNGFDVVFSFMSEVESTTEAAGIISTVTLGETELHTDDTDYAAVIADLTRQLELANAELFNLRKEIERVNELNARLELRLGGGA